MMTPNGTDRAPGPKSLRCLLLTSAACAALILGHASTASANPVGGVVASGAATVSTPNGSTVQIDQSTKIVIINWKSFNIAGGETTKFVQPNASSIAVNRIGGNDPSVILGNLLSNGRVVLINGNGILFGPNSQINVGSLIATTSDAPDADIASGKATFSKAGNPNAQIVNHGNITASTGGMVGLIAPAVSNSGTITAKLGSVTLGASNIFTLDFTGDGLVSFPVPGNVVAAAIDKNGKPVEALVVNNGKISGGTVLLTAKAAACLVTNVISMDGEIAATAAHQSGGRIVLDGGESGTVAVTGSLDASATTNGDGGTIKVVGQTTHFNGSASANGGSTSGNGGTIETSGHVLDVTGAKIDTTAAYGKTGTWTLDPENVTISSGSTAHNSADGGSPTDTYAPSGDDSVINAGELETALATSDVVVTTSGGGSQDGDITIASALTWSSAHTLTLNANKDIDINANAVLTLSGSAGLTLNAGNDINFGSAVSGPNFGDGTILMQGTGVLNLEHTGSLNFNLGNVSFSGAGTDGNSTRFENNTNFYTLVTSIASLAGDIASNASGRYALANYIDASGTTYTSSPIPTTFTGKFNGLGNTISGLTIHSTATGADVYVGLFAQTSNASSKIEHLRLTGVDITSADNSGMTFLGALVGVTNDGSVNDVSVSGSVTGGANNRTGGMFGYNGAAVSDSSADVTVVNGLGDEAGGIAGLNGGTLTNVTATGSVTGNNGENWVGGLIGSNNPTGTVTNSHATGDVSTTGTEVGGLIGDNHADVTNSYATGTVSGNDYTGGLIGYLDAGTVSSSHATGTVTGVSNSLDVGGLVGVVGSSTQLTGSYATGNVTGGDEVGGFAGYNNGEIDGSYATGSVTAVRIGTGSGLSNSFVGGLVGLNYATISASYATGAVNAGTVGSPLDYMSAGGLAGGSGGGSASIDSSYATGTVTVYGNNSEAGGLVGGAGDSVTNSWAGGAVELTGSAGQIGGLIGGNSASVQYDYAIGSVTGSGDSIQAGGLVGGDSGTIDNTYATGGVNGTGSSAEVGGVVGGEGTPTDITNSYWDSTTTGQAHGIGAGGGTDTAGATAVTSSTAYTQSIYSNFDFSGSGHWVILDSYTRPMLTAEESDTITDAHQLQLMSMNLGDSYTLANNIDLTGDYNASDVWKTATGFYPVGQGGGAFTGSFDGQGHTITGLHIDRPTAAYVGLFGYFYGTSIANVGLVNSGSDEVIGEEYVGGLAGNLQSGTITNSYSKIPVQGQQITGGLAGSNSGTIDRSYATGTVANLVSGTYYGGLVGWNTGGTITNSYASGNVNVVGLDAGGLVGGNDTGSSISGSYASGTVTSTNNNVGGLVGKNNGATISDSYAAGNVSGSINVGGLNGFVSGGTVSDSYSLGSASGTTHVGGSVGSSGGTFTDVFWDMETSGIGATQGSGDVTNQVGLTGETTSALQASLLTGFNATTWNIVAGKSLPYLAWQFSGTPEAISGIVYSDAGVTAVSGATVNIVTDGDVADTVTSYGNGFYYALLSPNALSLDGVAAMASASSGAFEDNSTSMAGLDIHGLDLRITTSDITLSQLGSNLGFTLGTQFYGTPQSTMGAILTALNTNLDIAASGAFTADQAMSTLGTVAITAAGTLTVTGTLHPQSDLTLTTTGGGHNIVIGADLSSVGQIITLNSAGTISQTSGVITASSLTGLSVGGATFNDTNLIGTLSTFANSGTGGFALKDGETLSVNGAVGAGTGALTLVTTSGNLSITNVLTAGTTVTLTSAGTIAESGSGAIDAASLTGSSTGAAAFTDASNHIGTLAGFTNTGGNFSLTDASALTLTGTLNATGHAVSLIDSAATISSNASGKITATTLTGSSHGAVTLNAANAITNLGAFTTNGNNAFAIADAHDLTITGAVNAGTAALTLTTTGTGDDIIVDNTLHGGTVTLTSAATISSNSSGKITATTLTGSSHGAVTLIAANVITNLGAFATNGNNAFAITDAHDLTVTGAVNAGTAALTLTTTGTGDDIIEDNTLHGGTVTLTSAATISSNTSGKITATTLTGSSHGAVTLNAANVITNLGAFTTNYSAFALTDAALLTTTGTVNAGTSTIALTTTGATSDGIAVKSHLSTSGSAGSVTLKSAGSVTETSAGAIVTHKLNVTAKTGITLTSTSNNITTLGTDTTVSGPNSVHL